MVLFPATYPAFASSELSNVTNGAAAPIAGKPHSGLIGDKALLGETSLSAAILGYVVDA